MAGIPVLTLLAGYAGAAVVFFVLDFVWLTIIAIGFYRSQIGALLLDQPNFLPAGAFYLFYVMGIVGFAVLPALAAQSWLWALIAGLALGLIAYGTYDMTNLATLRGWSLPMSLVDMGWGAALTGMAAVGGYFAARLAS